MPYLAMPDRDDSCEMLRGGAGSGRDAAACDVSGNTAAQHCQNRQSPAEVYQQRGCGCRRAGGASWSGQRGCVSRRQLPQRRRAPAGEGVWVCRRHNLGGDRFCCAGQRRDGDGEGRRHSNQAQVRLQQLPSAEAYHLAYPTAVAAAAAASQSSASSPTAAAAKGAWSRRGPAAAAAREPPERAVAGPAPCLWRSWFGLWRC